MTVKKKVVYNKFSNFQKIAIIMFKNETELEGVRGDVIGINNITSVISALAEAEDDVLTAKLLLCVLKKSDQAIIERISLN